MSQNDMDAIRYSQAYFGGSSRSKSMAGSFGALGADGSCLSGNPAGIGIYRKGEMNYSFGIRVLAAEARHNGTLSKNYKVNMPFDGFTLVGAWDSKLQPDNHHAIGIACNQIANFNANMTIEGRSNFKSISNDFLASALGNSVKNLDNTYSGLAYETYLIDTIDGAYYSLINPKYDLKQSQSIETSGRTNEWCFSYGYGYKDRLYLGATLGVPSVNYNHNSVYSELDDKDSVRIDNYDYPVWYYAGMGVFKSLAYQETFKTSGTGINLKVGAIYRVADFLRLGATFHTSTIYNLTDTYVYKMTASYDEGDSYTTEYPPDNGGTFNYKVITPMKFTGSIALLYQKMGAVNIDYDVVDYRNASLQSSPQEFTGVNNVIRNKYSQTSNVRIGAEANLKPMFVRLGYAMYGSPFGETFRGDFVKSFYTGGIGFRRQKMYIDISFSRSFNQENHYMYNSSYVDKSILNKKSTTVGVTIGSKF